jgi:regulator of replication initiation timing
MEEKEKYGNLLFNAREEEIKRIIDNLREANQRLELENDQLRKELEREQVLHRNLYNEWKELISGESVEKTEPVKIRRYIRKRYSRSFFWRIAITFFLVASVIYWVYSKKTGNQTSTEIPVTNTIALDTPKNNSKGLIQKFPIAKPSIKLDQKKNAVSPSSEKSIYPSRTNSTGDNNEMVGSQKNDSMLLVNKLQQK